MFSSSSGSNFSSSAPSSPSGGWGNKELEQSCLGSGKAIFAHLVFVLSVIFEGVGVGQVVDGDGQEDVKEDVVTTDEEDDEVEAGEDADALHAAEGLDAVVHDHVPILTGQDLWKGSG